MNKSTFIYFICLLVIIGCQSTKEKQQDQSSINNIQLSYAKGFSISPRQNYTCVTVYNPWKKGEVYARYYLVKQDSISTPKDGDKIRIPLQRMAANSSTYFAFLEDLGELKVVKGVCNSNYIYNPTILNGVKKGEIQDLGNAYNNDMENLLVLKPDAMMTTAYNSVDENNKRLKKIGIHLIYNIEWQEEHILGRAEWIKFIGAFFDKTQLADSLFKVTEKRYNNLKVIASKAKKKPSVLSGQDFRGTWTMPAGISFSNELFKDANISYYYAKDKSKGSISSTIEEVLMHFNTAEIWLGVQAKTYQQLEKANKKYTLFKAYKNKRVYNNGKRCTATGGSDYWESGVAHPDRILADLIKIAHPELLPKYETYYISPLK